MFNLNFFEEKKLILSICCVALLFSQVLNAKGEKTYKIFLAILELIQAYIKFYKEVLKLIALL